jgi:hypothetical protein
MRGGQIARQASAVSECCNILSGKETKPGGGRNVKIRQRSGGGPNEMERGRIPALIAHHQNPVEPPAKFKQLLPVIELVHFFQV